MWEFLLLFSFAVLVWDVMEMTRVKVVFRELISFGPSQSTTRILVRHGRRKEDDGERERD